MPLADETIETSQINGYFVIMRTLFCRSFWEFFKMSDFIDELPTEIPFIMCVMNKMSLQWAFDQTNVNLQWNWENDRVKRSNDWFPSIFHFSSNPHESQKKYENYRDFDKVLQRQPLLLRTFYGWQFVCHIRFLSHQKSRCISRDGKAFFFQI